MSFRRIGIKVTGARLDGAKLKATRGGRRKSVSAQIAERKSKRVRVAKRGTAA